MVQDVNSTDQPWLGAPAAGRAGQPGNAATRHGAEEPNLPAGGQPVAAQSLEVCACAKDWCCGSVKI